MVPYKKNAAWPGGQSLDNDLRSTVLPLHHGFANGSHHGESVDTWWQDTTQLALYQSGNTASCTTGVLRKRARQKPLSKIILTNQEHLVVVSVMSVECLKFKTVKTFVQYSFLCDWPRRRSQAQKYFKYHSLSLALHPNCLIQMLKFSKTDSSVTMWHSKKNGKTHTKLDHTLQAQKG